MVPTTRTVVHDSLIPTGDGPTGLTVSVDGRVYIGNVGDDTISVQDPATHETTTFASPPTPFALAVSPDGGLLYVVHTQISGPATVGMVRTTDHGTVGQIPLTGYSAGDTDLSPNGTRLYVGTNAGLTVINTFSQSVVTTVPIAGRPSGVSVTPYGTRVYVTCQDNGTVAVIDTASDALVTTISVSATPYYGIAITPDRRRVYVPHLAGTPSAGSVSVIDTDPASATYHGVIATVATAASPITTAASPDGGHVYVTKLRDDHVASLIVGAPSVYDVVDTIAVPPDPIPRTRDQRRRPVPLRLELRRRHRRGAEDPLTVSPSWWLSSARRGLRPSRSAACPRPKR